MTSLSTVALSLPPPRAQARPRPAQPVVLRPQLLPIPHSPESMEGIPWYDEEFDVAQSRAHSETIAYLAAQLGRVAADAGLYPVSDNPVWYWPPGAPEQKVLYPDYALTANPDASRLMATELVLAVEVVSTATREKEEKDTVRMRACHAVHGVREFVLIYPEPEDPRSVVWHRYDERRGRYRVAPLPVRRRYRSVAIPGLEVEVLPRSAWRLGRKLRVWFRGVEFREAAEEAARAEQQAARAEQQAARAEQQAARAEQERAAKEQERARAEQERARAEQERARAEQERAAREQEAQARYAAEQRAARLAERLRALGVDPEAE